MKAGVWIVVVIVILAATGVFFFSNNTEVRPDTPKEKAPSSIELLKNATFAVPESETVVTLVNGEAFYQVDPQSSQQGDILLLDKTSAEWTKDGRTDLAAVFAVNGGGTGTFLYLVLFDVKGNTLTKKSEEFLGDRIDVTKVGVGELVNDLNADYRLTVQTLVRKEGESYTAEPTVQKTRTFYVTKQVLKEVDTAGDDS